MKNGTRKELLAGVNRHLSHKNRISPDRRRRLELVRKALKASIRLQEKIDAQLETSMSARFKTP